jgi:hypothetical protein
MRGAFCLALGAAIGLLPIVLAAVQGLPTTDAWLALAGSLTVFWPVGGILVWKGLERLGGRTELEVGPNRIRVLRRMLGFSRVRTGPAEPVEDLLLLSDENGTSELRFTFSGGRPLRVARGYPSSFLERFARELAERHGFPYDGPGGPAPTAPAASREPRPVPPPRALPGPAPRPAPPRVPPKGDTGITFLPEPGPAPAPAPTKGECQVCNGPLAGDLVACARCRTLHHRGCWDYVRRCSTYACGSVQMRSAVRAPEDGVVVFSEPEGGAGRRRSGRKAVREWLRAVAEEHRWGSVRSRERRHRHCEVTFAVGRLVCVLEGRKSGDEIKFLLRATLPSEELRERARAARIPSRYEWIHRRVSSQELRLEPLTRIDGLPLLRGFVRGCLQHLEEIAGASEGARPWESG